MTTYKIVDKSTGEKKAPRDFDSMTDAAIYALENDIIGCNIEPAGEGIIGDGGITRPRSAPTLE
jgi:hypothetical protein